MDDDWSGYESGPFCRHWSDPVDCDIKCARCGVKCCQHGTDPESCEEWAEPD